MTKPERLLRLLTYLRSRRRPVTAQALADRLEVSIRTIYRDVQALTLTGVSIEGEAGLGYYLQEQHSIPPLMFSRDELEALILGARMTQSWTDQTMAKCATDALNKIASVLPWHMQDMLDNREILVPDNQLCEVVSTRLEGVRTAIRENRRIDLHYKDEAGNTTLRTLRPLGLFYWGRTWTITAWCELRNGFRIFRIDRIVDIDVRDDVFTQEDGKRLDDFLGDLGKKDFS